MAWIEANDSELRASITKHEGDLNTIFAMAAQNSLPIPPACNIAQCQERQLWPAYICSAGHNTVGIGHKITGNEGFDCYQGLTDEQVADLFARDIAEHLDAAKRIAQDYEMDIADNQVVQRFMVEMCFNIGAGTYRKFRNGLKKLTSAVNDNTASDSQVYNYNQAADEHLDSRWAKQVGDRAIAMTNTLRALD